MLHQQLYESIVRICNAYDMCCWAWLDPAVLPRHAACCQCNTACHKGSHMGVCMSVCELGWLCRGTTGVPGAGLSGPCVTKFGYSISAASNTTTMSTHAYLAHKRALLSHSAQQSTSQQRFVDKVCKLAGLAVAVGYVVLLQHCLQLRPQLLRLVLCMTRQHAGARVNRQSIRQIESTASLAQSDSTLIPHMMMTS